MLCVLEIGSFKNLDQNSVFFRVLVKVFFVFGHKTIKTHKTFLAEKVANRLLSQSLLGAVATATGWKPLPVFFASFLNLLQVL